jgi:hypothetical protein
MNDLTLALRSKISALQDEKEELEDALNRIVIKLETYEELLVEEEGGKRAASPSPAKKRRGRPKGSKNKRVPSKVSKDTAAPEDPVWEEAKASLPGGMDPTSPEEQEKAVRRFRPTPRPVENYGVKAGRPEDVMGEQGKKKSNVNIAVED